MAGWGGGSEAAEGGGGGVVGLFFTVEGGFWGSLGKNSKGEGEICWGAALGGGGGVVYNRVEDDSKDVSYSSSEHMIRHSKEQPSD